jgi:hypothetical protein
MRREQEGLLRKIQEIQRSTPAPIDQAIDMLRLTSRASELFLQQTASEQRRLLQAVVEQASWKDRQLQTALFEPFEILRHSNQETYRKEREKLGSGRDFEIWLPGMDSNHVELGKTLKLSRLGEAGFIGDDECSRPTAAAPGTRMVFPSALDTDGTGRQDREVPPGRRCTADRCARRKQDPRSGFCGRHDR